MKKLLLSFLLLMSSVVTWATHWTSVSAYDYPSSTPIYAQITINGGVANADSIVEIAAFINGKCRAVASTTVQSKSSSQEFYLLRVLGDENDLGAEVTFKVFYGGLEYSVTPSSNITFDTNTHMPVNFYVDALTGVTITRDLTYIEDVPFSHDLTSEITLLYQNKKGENVTLTGKSSILSEISYYWTSYSTAFTVVNNAIEASGECISKYLKLVVSGPNYTDGRYVRTCGSYVTISKPISFTYPSTIEMNRYTTTSVQLSDVQGILFEPDNVTFLFTDLCGVPVAVFCPNDDNDQYFYDIYANMAGKTKYEVYYGSQKMKSADGEEYGTLIVNANIGLNSGWNWTSLYSVDATAGNINLMNNSGEYQDWVTSNLSEIRSQLSILYNDANYGLFGDIEELNVADGMYKIKANSSMTIASGYDVESIFEESKDIRTGYNWINNPYQLDLSLDDISSAFQNKPIYGDRIIGKDAFIEYNGRKWEGSSDFILEAGKGYMYYSNKAATYSLTLNSDIIYTVNSSLNTNVSYFVPAKAKRRTEAPHSKSSIWNYNSSAYADNMTMVALVEDVEDVENYSIGAFVGEECRGEGKVSESGKMFINVAGQTGDIVSFKLLNKVTGEVSNIKESVNYTNNIGSLKSPAKLTIGDVVTDIDEVDVNIDEDNIIAIFDIYGRKVSSMTTGVYFVKYNVNGRTVTKKILK
ncbi:MAG: T9SS type A sorting domain-containing protein [Bacteroidaceae bacterium]|nr:T9SS type A sorting domain-containing protein [Bacteroidaceae bacterium]